MPPASQPTETPATGAQDSARSAGSQEAAVRTRRVADGATTPILPDCCNLGITVRVLVAMNLAACLLAFASGVASGDPFDRLLEIVLILEPVTLASLVCLCALRKSVNGMALPVQWTVGILVPTLLTLIVCVLTRGMVHADAETGRFALWVLTRCLAAAAIGWLAIEYFRLRALSFSPSLAEARLQALQARIRPHFLFNSLNTVLGLMRGDPRRAEHTLENLSDLFRVFMRDTRELVPLDEEVVTCQQYLAIEQLRLGDRLQVVWRLDDMAADALLPSLLLQPLIENAVHHGIEPRTEPGEVSVAITRSGERVRVEILNPVAADHPTKPGNQMALSNVRERLMLLYDMEAELKTSVDHDQFRLVLEFPYRKERRRRDVRRHFSPYS